MFGRANVAITAMMVLVIFNGIESKINVDHPVPVPVGERNTISEGPYWDENFQLLFFVDMTENILNSYDPVTDKHVRVKINSDDCPVTFMVRVKSTDDMWMLGLRGRLVTVRWNGRTTTPLVPKHYLHVEDPSSNSRLNDAKCDPSHRLWAGSMGGQTGSNPNTFEEDKGSLFLVKNDGSLWKKESYLQISNGLDWSLKGDKMYFIDSLQYKLFQYDFNNKNGDISNKVVLFDLKKEGLVKPMNSLPDGMTVDQEGFLWVAVYGTQKVLRIDPSSGKKVFEITIPQALEITSVAFGGKNMDILFVTTARVDWNSDLEKEYPKSGYLFKVMDLGVKGTKSRSCAFDNVKNINSETCNIKQWKACLKYMKDYVLMKGRKIISVL